MATRPRTAKIHTPDILQCNFLPARQVSRQVARLYDKHLAPVALTATQFVIMSLLSANPGMSMRDMGNTLTIERSALLRTIKPLTRDGLVETVRPSEPGARQFSFQLTAAGEGRYSRAIPYWHAAQLVFDRILGEAFSAELRGQLGALAGAFNALAPTRRQA